MKGGKDSTVIYDECGQPANGGIALTNGR